MEISYSLMQSRPLTRKGIGKGSRGGMSDGFKKTDDTRSIHHSGETVIQTRGEPARSFLKGDGFIVRFKFAHFVCS